MLRGLLRKLTSNEWLVVVAIIAILTGIILPVIFGKQSTRNMGKKHDHSVELPVGAHEIIQVDYDEETNNIRVWYRPYSGRQLRSATYEWDQQEGYK